MAKFFIIGGCGFVGSHISRRLLSEGDEVVCFDAFLNFIDPLKSNYERILKARLSDIKDKVKIIRGDIRHKGDLLRALREEKPEVVIHLAALPIATKSNEFPEDAISINLDGLVNVLESLRELGSVKRFVYTSSSFVYGDFVKEVADEEHPLNPIDIYGGTKLAGEVLTRAYSKKFGIDYTIIRPSAVYGPGDANRRVSQVFVENALKGEPLKLFDGGLEKIDFTHVTDAATGFVLAAKSAKAKNETFNITAGNARTIKEFAELVAKHVPNTKFVESGTDIRRPKRGSLSIEKAKRLLGFSPKTNIEEGIEKYVEFVKKTG